MSIIPKVTKTTSKSCCERVGNPGWGEYICNNCGALNCHLHASLWTDHKLHCFFCFAPTKCLRIPITIPYEKKDHIIRYKQRALIVVDGLYIAGVQRHCLEILNVFKNEGIGCVILAIDGGGQWANDFIELSECVVIDIDNSISWDMLREILQFDNFNFVSAHLTDAIEWTTKHVPLSIPRYAHFHSESSEHELITEAWLRFYCKNYDSIFFPTNTVLQHFVKEFGIRKNGNSIKSKLQILPNGIPHHIETISTYNGEGKKKKSAVINLAIISRIDEDKFSIPLFIDTILHLFRICSDIQIFIAGDGESMNELKEVIDNSGISKKIKLLGFINNISKIYEWADVIFLPSKREGMPYVLLECIAFACPLVAPNIGVFQEITTTGLIYKFRRDNSLEAAHSIYRASIMKDDDRKVAQRVLLKSMKISSRHWVNIVKEMYKLK